MTRIEFFFNVENKLQQIADLCEKITGKGRRLLVFAPDKELTLRLEQLLWTHPATGFMPHCRAESPLAPLTPVVIDSHGEKLAHDEVLINLHNQHPPFFSRFTQLIEIVGMDEPDKAEARLRYGFYRDRGYEIKHFDALKAGSE
jgi:DNA polymerase-3 subunit chi